MQRVNTETLMICGRNDTTVQGGRPFRGCCHVLKSGFPQLSFKKKSQGWENKLMLGL